MHDFEEGATVVRYDAYRGPISEGVTTEEVDPPFVFQMMHLDKGDEGYEELRTIIELMTDKSSDDDPPPSAPDSAVPWWLAEDDDEDDDGLDVLRPTG